jgi:hypothetical protein
LEVVFKKLFLAHISLRHRSFVPIDFKLVIESIVVPLYLEYDIKARILKFGEDLIKYGWWQASIKTQ